MLYCTYEQYQTAGGTLDEAAYAVRPGFPAHRPAHLWPGRAPRQGLCRVRRSSGHGLCVHRAEP